MAPTLGLKVDEAAVNSLTRGYVGDTSFAVLPNISPGVTFLATILSQLVTSLSPKHPRPPLTDPSLVL